MKVGSVSSWLDKKWTENWIMNAADTLEKACLQIVYIKPEETLTDDTQPQASPPSTASSVTDNQFYYPVEEEEFQRNEGHLTLFKRALQREIDCFLQNFIDTETINENLKNSNEFWKKNRQKMPILYNLMIKIVSIPASTAYIERFFSVCGVVCRNRAMNMKDELVIIRCLLKANLKWLEELAHITE